MATDNLETEETTLTTPPQETETDEHIKVESEAIGDDGDDFIVVSRKKAKKVSPPEISNEDAPVKEKEQHRLYKTELCVFFSRGQCDKGDACAYAHGDAELRNSNRRPSDPRLEFPDIDTPGAFPFCVSGGSGRSMHSSYRNVVKTQANTNFKSTLCANVRDGKSCLYGSKCNYAHTQDELLPALCRDFPSCGREDCPFRHTLVSSPNGVRGYMNNASDKSKTLPPPIAVTPEDSKKESHSSSKKTSTNDSKKEKVLKKKESHSKKETTKSETVHSEITPRENQDETRTIVIEMSNFDPSKVDSVCAIIAGLAKVTNLSILIR
jgi:hypothetical protein